MTSEGSTTLLDGVTTALADLVVTDPVNLLIGLGTGGLAVGYLLLEAARSGNRSRRLEAPGPQPHVAIHYEYGDRLGRTWRWLPALLVIAIWMFEMWDRERGAFDLWKLAIIGVPLLIFQLVQQRRFFRDRPAVALYREGIRLDSWRGETLVPWTEIASIETDPAVSTGYQPNTHLKLLVERKDGRRWRYFEQDFGDDAPDKFETIVEQAQRFLQ